MTYPFRSRLRAAVPLLTLGLVFPFTSPLLAGELARALPENCLFFAEARSLPALLKAGEHPLVKKLVEGEMKTVIEKILESSPENEKAGKVFEEEAGKSRSEVLALFSGGIAVGGVLPMEQALEDDFSEVGLVAAADFSGDEELVGKAMLAWVKAQDSTAEENLAGDDDDESESDWPEDFEEVVSDVDGVSLHEWLPKDRDNKEAVKVIWALAGGRLVFGMGEADMREAVRRVMRKSDEGSMAATPVYREMETAVGDMDLFGGINLERGVPSVVEAIRKSIEENGPPKGVPINVLQAINGAGLGHLRALFLSADLREETLDFRAGLTYAEKPLLLKFYASKGSGEPPLFTPDNANEVTWGTLDWGGMFDGLRELITETFPMGAGALEMGLSSVKKRTGVDLRKDLLGQMGPSLWSMSAVKPPDGDGSPDSDNGDDGEDEEEGEGVSIGSRFEMPPGASAVIGVSLLDTKAFSLSLGTLFNTLAPGKALFEDRDYLGNTIHELKGVSPELRTAWLIKGDTLIVSRGEPELLEKVLAGMEKKPAEPLLEREYVKKAFSRLPGEEVSSTYSDSGLLLDALIQGMKEGYENVLIPNETSKAFTDLPDRINIPLFGVSRVYLSDRSFEVRTSFELKP